jgi:hypothetical protein
VVIGLKNTLEDMGRAGMGLSGEGKIPQVVF